MHILLPVHNCKVAVSCETRNRGGGGGGGGIPYRGAKSPPCALVDRNVNGEVYRDILQNTSGYRYRYHVTLHTGQQHPIIVYRTVFWVCIALVLSVIRCCCYHYLDRILFHHKVPGFETDCPCVVWCRGLSACLLYVGPLFKNLV